MSTFNSPLETGIRSLFLLAATPRRSLDLQKLVYFDYLVVHTGDLGGPPSLHPVTPSQSSELLVRRQLLTDGLALVRSRELVERKLLKSGISFKATRAGCHVTEAFRSDYALQLQRRASWVADTFGDVSDHAVRRTLGDVVVAWDDEIVDELPLSRYLEW